MTPDRRGSNHHAPLSVRESLRGRHVLLTGASGFVGKVWLAMLLDRVPEVGRVYVLLRPKALVAARSRFEKFVNTSPAFRPLRERHGPELGAFLRDKVEIVDGDVTSPELGLDTVLVRRLRAELDLVVHCAGLVDFNPDLGKALATNVEGVLRVADFVETTKQARLLHVSTCFVAGERHGRIPEALVADYAPDGRDFDAERELTATREAIARIRAEHASEAHRARVHAEVDALVHRKHDDPSSRIVETFVRRRLRNELREALVDEGMRRARARGWPNTYTYSKSLAESLLARRSKRLRFAIVRPSIVESAHEFPFPGWNESFNGTAPLAYVMGTWFRAVPAKPDAPFDVVPVDFVCHAMTSVAAALLEDRAAPVYHVGTSDRNRLSVGRAAELIVLAHRRHYRSHGKNTLERVLKSRWDAVLVEPRSAFGLEASRELVRASHEALDLLPDKLRAKLRRWSDAAARADRKLDQIQELVQLYLPFMYEGFHVFESPALDAIRPVEPEFAFAPEKLEWRRYWLDTHMPGLRKWTFPLIEGKRPPRDRAEHPVRLSTPPEAPARAAEPRSTRIAQEELT